MASAHWEALSKVEKQRKSKFLAGNNFEFDRTRRIFVILSTFQALRKEGSLVSSLSLCNIFLDVSFVKKKTFGGLKTNYDLISRTTMLITSWLVLLPYRMSGYLDWAGFKTSWSNHLDVLTYILTQTQVCHGRLYIPSGVAGGRLTHHFQI